MFSCLHVFVHKHNGVFGLECLDIFVPLVAHIVQCDVIITGAARGGGTGTCAAAEDSLPPSTALIASAANAACAYGLYHQESSLV